MSAEPKTTTMDGWSRYRDTRILEILEDVAFVVGVEGPGHHQTRKKFAAFIRSIKERVQ